MAKTPVGQIDVYDGDRFRQHNAFRSPGARRRTSSAGVRTRPSTSPGDIEPCTGTSLAIPTLSTQAVDELAGADFVFMAIDRGDAKGTIIAKLEELGIPFIDLGMGVAETTGSLGGIVRMTSSILDGHGRAGPDQLGRPDPNNDYRVNIQIADLNALNAALAVIRWKKSLGFYRDLVHENNAIYVIDQNDIVNEDQW